MRNQTRLALAIAAVIITSLSSYYVLVRDEQLSIGWKSIAWKFETQQMANQSDELRLKLRQAPQILVVVFTAPNGIERRNALRDTWLSAKSHAEYGLLHVFLLGRSEGVMQEKLNQEMAQHQDMYVDFQFEDKYEHLSHKMLAMLRLAEERLINTSVQYVLKTDDDTMINWPLMLDGLLECERKVPHGRFIAGLVSHNVGPNRKRGDKYYVSESEFAHDKYPPFAHGPAYFVSVRAIRSLLQATAVVTFLHLEDVYLACLAQSANVTVLDPGGFYIWSPKNWQQMQKLRSAHYIKPGDMRKLWQQYLLSITNDAATTATTTTTTTAITSNCENCTSVSKAGST